jgi:hypothetical protein
LRDFPSSTAASLDDFPKKNNLAALSFFPPEQRFRLSLASLFLARKLKMTPRSDRRSTPCPMSSSFFSIF